MGSASPSCRYEIHEEIRVLSWCFITVFSYGFPVVFHRFPWRFLHVDISLCGASADIFSHLDSRRWKKWDVFIKFYK